MSVTAYPTLRLKLTMPQALKLQFLPAIPGSNAAAAAAAAEAAAAQAIAAANTAVAATANKVDRTGDVMSGFLTVLEPTSALHAATKHYVDTHSGGGGGAPTTAEYITSTADATLTAERVLTNTATVTWDFTTPGQAKANTAAGGGNVSNSGTPTVGQYGKWVTATTIQGVSAATVLSDIAAAPVGAQYITSAADATLTAERVLTNTTSITWDFATAAQGKANLAALSGDVTTTAGGVATTIASAAVTYAKLQNTSAASVLLGRGSAAGAGVPQEITLGAGVTMTGTVLSASAGGGNVSNSGTPASGQVAEWVTATTIAGVTTYAKLASPTFSGTPNLPTGTVGVTQTAGNSTTALATTAFVQTAVADAINAGRLTWISTTALAFKPYNGDRIKISGGVFQIPSAGIAGLANTSIRINGTAGQNLAASTSYYVYVFNNAGTLTADYSTTGHSVSATAGNVGTEIKSGDDTRTLIGLILTNASSQFQSDDTWRGVSSWFNRRDLAVLGNSTGGTSTSSTTNVEILAASRAWFLTWADEAVFAGITGTVFNSTAAIVLPNLGLDGATTLLLSQGPQFNMAAGAYSQIAGTAAVSTISEGAHFLTPVANVNAGSGSFFVYVSATIRG